MELRHPHPSPLETSRPPASQLADRAAPNTGMRAQQSFGGVRLMEWFRSHRGEPLTGHLHALSLESERRGET